MKRNFLLILMLITASISIHAQGNTFIKWGICSSSYWGENSIGTSSKQGFMLGVAMDTPIGNSNFSVGPTFELISKGGKLKTDDGYDIALNAVYLEVPLDLIYHIKINKENSVSLAAGPYMAYGIGGNDGDTFDDRTGLDRMDAGLHFGLGYEYKRLLLNGSCDVGLKNVASNCPKNFAFILSMGIKI